jgi:hypothetical protein
MQASSSDARAYGCIPDAYPGCALKQFLVGKGKPRGISGYRLQNNSIHITFSTVMEAVSLSLGTTRSRAGIQNVYPFACPVAGAGCFFVAIAAANSESRNTQIEGNLAEEFRCVYYAER